MKINEREIELKVTGYTLLCYKEEFHKDFLTCVENLENVIGSDYLAIFEMVWAMAKSSDESIPSFKEFMKSSSITDVLSRGTMEEIKKAFETIKPTKEVKKN